MFVHDYFGIDFGIVWSAVESDVPALEEAVTDLPRRLDCGEGGGDGAGFGSDH